MLGSANASLWCSSGHSSTAVYKVFIAKDRKNIRYVLIEWMEKSGLYVVQRMKKRYCVWYSNELLWKITAIEEQWRSIISVNDKYSNWNMNNATTTIYRKQRKRIFSNMWKKLFGNQQETRHKKEYVNDIEWQMLLSCTSWTANYSE